MTAAVVIPGLLSVMWICGADAEVLKCIATAMFDGVIASTLMELLVYPAIFYVWRSRRISVNSGGIDPLPS